MNERLNSLGLELRIKNGGFSVGIKDRKVLIPRISSHVADHANYAGVNVHTYCASSLTTTGSDMVHEMEKVACKAKRRSLNPKKI